MDNKKSNTKSAKQAKTNSVEFADELNTENSTDKCTKNLSKNDCK